MFRTETSKHCRGSQTKKAGKYKSSAFTNRRQFADITINFMSYQASLIKTKLACLAIQAQCAGERNLELVTNRNRVHFTVDVNCHLNGVCITDAHQSADCKASVHEHTCLSRIEWSRFTIGALSGMHRQSSKLNASKITDNSILMPKNVRSGTRPWVSATLGLHIHTSAGGGKPKLCRVYAAISQAGLTLARKLSTTESKDITFVILSAFWVQGRHVKHVLKEDAAFGHHKRFYISSFTQSCRSLPISCSHHSLQVSSG